MTTSIKEIKKVVYGNINTHSVNPQSVVLTDEKELTLDSPTRYLIHFIKSYIARLFQSHQLPSLTDSVKVFFSPVQVKNAKNDKVSAKFTTKYIADGLTKSGKPKSKFDGYTNELLVTSRDNTFDILHDVLLSVIAYQTQSKRNEIAFRQLMFYCGLSDEKGLYNDTAINTFIQSYISKYGDLNCVYITPEKVKDTDDKPILWMKFITTAGNGLKIQGKIKILPEDYKALPLETKKHFDSIFTLSEDKVEVKVKSTDKVDTSYLVKSLQSVLNDMQYTLDKKRLCRYDVNTLNFITSDKVLNDKNEVVTPSVNQSIHDNIVKHHAWIANQEKQSALNKAKQLQVMETSFDL